MFRWQDPNMTAKDLRAAFDEAYWRRFRMRMPEARAMLVRLHAAVIGRRSRLDLKVFANSANDRVGDTTPATRKVWFESGWHETHIYRRDWLTSKNTLCRAGDRGAARRNDRDRARAAGQR